MRGENELALLHGFEGFDFPCDISDAFDVSGVGEGEICRFSHGYTSAWESQVEESWEAQLDFGDQMKESFSDYAPSDDTADDSAPGLVHGEDAAAWAAVARRALLRRMDEE